MESHKNPKNIENVKRRNLWGMNALLLIDGFGGGMSIATFQPYILAFTGSMFLTGVLTTLGVILLTFPKPFIGKLSDRYGRKKIFLLGTPNLILGFFLIIIANNLFLLVMGVMILNLGSSFGSLGVYMFVSESSKESRRGFNFGLIAFAFFGGGVFGKYFVTFGLFSDIRIYFVIFIILFFFEFLIQIFILFDPNPVIPVRMSNSSNNNKVPENIWKKLLSNPKTKTIIIFFTLDGLIYGTSGALYIAGLSSFYDLSTENIAFISLWFSVSSTIFQIPAGHFADRIGKRKSLVISQIFGIGYFSFIILGFIAWNLGFSLMLFLFLIIGEFLQGICVSTFIPSEGMTVTDLDETGKRKAEAYGIVSFIRGVGFIPTGIFAGFLIEYVHYIAPFIITIVGILILILILHKYFHD